MASVETRQEDFVSVVGPLRVRVGLVFERGKEPRNAQDMIRHPASPGSKWAKFYFPPTSANLLLEGRVDCAVPASMIGALFGELLLKLSGSPKKRHGSKITFGRFGEDKPFEFNEESSYLPLRISRPEEGEFNTLYVRHNQQDKDPEYFALVVSWIGNIIGLRLDPVESDEVPPFLVDQ